MKRTATEFCTTISRFEGISGLCAALEEEAINTPLLLILAEDEGQMRDAEEVEHLVEILRKSGALSIFACPSLLGISEEALLAFDVRLVASSEESPCQSTDSNARFTLLRGKRKDLPLCEVLDIETTFTDAVEGYVQRLCKDSTPFQTRALVACLTAAERGGSEAVLREESHQFYRLMRKKAEEGVRA